MYLKSIEYLKHQDVDERFSMNGKKLAHADRYPAGILNRQVIIRSENAKERYAGGHQDYYKANKIQYN